MEAERKAKEEAESMAGTERQDAGRKAKDEAECMQRIVSWECIC